MNNKIEALRARKADGGFTLVELLIVIVVLGILAGITVFGVASFRDDANVAACKANLKTVQVAAEAYNAKTGAYPANEGVLTSGNYIKSAPTTPTITYSTSAVPTGTC